MTQSQYIHAPEHHVRIRFSLFAVLRIIGFVDDMGSIAVVVVNQE